MFTYNPRMVEGSPLYYNIYSTPTLGNQFPFFQRFEPYGLVDMSEDILRSHTPNSEQSDSDNSLSSVEISLSTIKNPISNTVNYKKSEVKCCWKNCGITFSSLDQLSTHVTRDHAFSGLGGLFYCGWEGCSRNNRGFNARYKMLVHVRTHTNEKPHKCEQCEKSFSRAENLKIHSRSHSGEKPYICPVPGCNKAYSNSSDRFKHTRTHQVEKPYQCKVPGCPKRYTDPSSLRKHVKTYKHFVNENVINEENTQNTNESYKIQSNKAIETYTKENQEQVKDNPIKSTNDQYYQRTDNNHSCTCTHTCCVSNKTNEFLRLGVGTFINFKEESINTMPWNKLLDPFMHEPKSIFKSYDIKDEQMDIDVPLDLSIRRTHTFN